MTDPAAPRLSPPQFVQWPDRRIGGILRRHHMQTRSTIPDQWAVFDARASDLPGAVPDAWYGVCANSGAGDDSFDYLCGMECAEGPLAPGLQSLVLPAGRWARFVQPGHVSTMAATWDEIFGHWLGRPGLTPRDGPSTELYLPAFDGRTGEGGFEIWVPVV